MKRIIKQKLNNRSGYSLVELMACIVVLILVTGIITLVVNMSVKYYTQSMRQSAADILCASLSTAVQEELNYAMNVEPDGGVVYYHSRARNHDKDCCLAVSDGSNYASNGTVLSGDSGSISGQIGVYKVLSRDADNNNKPLTGEFYPLVGSKSYVDGITANVSALYTAAVNGFAVTIDIYDLDGTTKLSTNSFNVYPLNKGN